MDYQHRNERPHFPREIRERISHDERRYTIVEREYNIQSLLGKGAFGRVYLGINKRNGFSYALKCIMKNNMTSYDKLMREVNIQMTLRHPNVLRLWECVREVEYMCLVLEYANNGSIRDHLRRSWNFSETTSGSIVGQVVAGLEYCHKSGVIHRDLKPDNLLVTQSNVIKIADFGISAYATRPRHTFCGTSEYMAPEILKGYPYDHLVDIWSVGVITFEMLAGRSPFRGYSHSSTHRNIVRSTYNFPSYLSSGPKDLIIKLLRRNPEERLMLTAVLRHRWINNSKNIPIPRTSEGYIT